MRHGPSLIESLWRYRLPVIGVTLLMGVLGYLLGLQEDEAYEATAVLYLADPNLARVGDLNNTFLEAEDFVPREAARITSRNVLSAAADAAGTSMSSGDLAEALDVEASAETLSISLTVIEDTPDGAAALANAVADAYREQKRAAEEQRVLDAVEQLQIQVQGFVEEREATIALLEDEQENRSLQSRIESLDREILEGRARIDNALLQARLRSDGVDQFEPARPPEFPSRPRPALTAAAFAFLGMVGMSIWAYWYAFKSQRVLNRTDPEQVLGVPPLGEIPLYRITSEDPLTGLLRVDPAAAEAYEFVLSSIEFALADQGGKSLLISSTLPGDGKTTTTLQLAIAASRDRRRVVLVDADIRARGLTRVLGADDRPGLSDLAALDLEPSEVLRRYKFSEQSQIPVVTAGQRRGDPAALLRTHSFRKAMQGINDSAELLIVDSSPLLAVADATIVAGTVDGIVIVVSHGTPVSELEKVRERLKFVSTPLLGYIYNRSDSSTAGAYGYGYGVAEDVDGERRLLPRGLESRRRRGDDGPVDDGDTSKREGRRSGQDDGDEASSDLVRLRRARRSAADTP